MGERFAVRRVFDNVIAPFNGLYQAFESQRQVADSIGIQLGNQRQSQLIALGASWGVIDIPDKKGTLLIGFRCPLESQSVVASIVADAGFRICSTCKKVNAETGDETIHLYI